MHGVWCRLSTIRLWVNWGMNALTMRVGITWAANRRFRQTTRPGLGYRMKVQSKAIFKGTRIRPVLDRKALGLSVASGDSSMQATLHSGSYRASESSFLKRIQDNFLYQVSNRSSMLKIRKHQRSGMTKKGPYSGLFIYNKYTAKNRWRHRQSHFSRIDDRMYLFRPVGNLTP